MTANESAAMDSDAMARPRLRNLGEEEFRAAYGCDRYTATVLGNRFDYLVEHMSARLLTGAFSPILRDFYDLASTLSGPPELGYLVPAASNGIVLMAGTTIDAVANTLREFGADRLRPGDVLVANDPYRTGNHNNDLLFIRPVFHEGRIIATVNLNAHQLDMGGTVPGGFSAAKHNVYENGLVLSPRLLVNGGEPVPETWNLIFDNVRMAEILYPDMLTVCSSLELGEELVRQSVDRYGLAAFHGTMRYLCDAAAERIARALEAMPDGDWSGSELVDCDGVDDSEEYVVRVSLRKRGAHLEIDFSGTSRQARSSINATVWDTKTAVGIALKYLFDPKGRFSSGLYRPVDIVLPEGTIVSALPPDGAVFMYFEQSQAVLAAILRALAPVLGAEALAGDRGSADLHTAFGQHGDGTPWVSALQCGGEIGPYGANRHGDADTQCMSYNANGVAPEVEAIEKDTPVVMLRHEPMPDSAGPGTYRGGAAMVRDTLWLTSAAHSFTPLRYKRPAGFGVHGGASGARGGVWVHAPAPAAEAYPGLPADDFDRGTQWAGLRATGEYIYPFHPATRPSTPGSVLRYLTNGGGGWGRPGGRDPEAVLRDVRDGYVSAAGAVRDYGVVVLGDPEGDPEGLRVDPAATKKLRATMSNDIQP